MSRGPQGSCSRLGTRIRPIIGVRARRDWRQSGAGVSLEGEQGRVFTSPCPVQGRIRPCVVTLLQCPCRSAPGRGSVPRPRICERGANRSLCLRPAHHGAQCGSFATSRQDPVCPSAQRLQRTRASPPQPAEIPSARSGSPDGNRQ